MYEGAEVETDINVLDGDICPRMSLCVHDVLVEDVPAEDVTVEDMMSTKGLYDLLRMSPSRTASVETSSSRTWCPHRDIHPRTSCPCVDIRSSTGSS